MDSTSHAIVYSRGNKSGGKILKKRPRKTPMRQENPDWMNTLVSPAKFVAGGATKLISSVWNPKSWDSNSTSSESDSYTEGGIKDDHERCENLLDGGADLKKNKGSSSGKSEILYLIEQLLMRERFSRKECDRLKKMIKMRVIDYNMREGVDAGPSSPNISNKLIMKARKMITKNPVGSSLKSDLDNSIHGSKSLMTPKKDRLLGGSWSIQRLGSKAIELIKPNSRNETVNMASKGKATIQVDVPNKALLLLPPIKEKYQVTEEKDVNRNEGKGDMITEYAEVADDINASQGSSNTNDTASTYETGTSRTRIYNTRSRSRKKYQFKFNSDKSESPYNF